ncbi:MAG: ABC transporter permease DevC, partial [Solirubrobacteraceae bacterium]
VLILMQLGFREAMFTSSVRLLERLRYDVVLISNDTAFIVAPATFAEARLHQARAVPGVASVAPVRTWLGSFENPQNHSVRRIFIIGVRPSDDPIDVPEISRQLAAVKSEDKVLFDERSRPEFGPIGALVREHGPLRVEINQREVQVVGTFPLGSSFGIDGNVVTSDINFLRLLPIHALGEINIGLVRAAPGVSPDVLRDRIRAAVDRDVLVLTRPEWIAREKAYWGATTPIGYVFTFGTIVGLFVGAIIVYQILFADVSDHLPEYATLKAMGYTNLYVSSVVVQQAVILAVCGFVPGLAISAWLYGVAGAATRLPMELTPQRIATVLGLTIAMCAVSALFALRKVRRADPAEIF